MAALLSPLNLGVLRFMTRFNPDHRVEVTPGIYTHICPDTDLPETVITPKGLRHVRSLQVPESLAAASEQLADAGDRLALVEDLMRRCAGNRRRQARVRR
jgi:hypothetical protein